MKCKQHPFERGPGVCAPCLRDRLLAILLEETQSASASAICSPSAPSSAGSVPHHKGQRYARADSLPSASDEPRLAFPRSVSPYVSHRRSVDCDGPRRGGRSPLFYSTPQIGSVGGGAGGGGGGRGGRKRWSLLSALLFRNGKRGDSKSDADTYSDPPTGESAKTPSASSSSSSSWFSWFGRSKSKNTGRTGSVAVGGSRHNPAHRISTGHPRGMSPDTSAADDGGREHNYYDPDHDLSGHFTSSQHHSDYSTTTDLSFHSPAWRIPGPTPLRKTHGGGGRQLTSGFAVCLSPLVWASPGPQQRRGNQPVAADGGCSGELKPGRRRTGSCQPRHRHHGSDGPMLGPNRSRKLADRGTLR